MKIIKYALLQKVYILGKIACLTFFGLCMFSSCNSDKGNDNKNDGIVKEKNISTPEYNPWASKKKAIAEFTKVLEKNPRDYSALKGRAESLKDIGKYEKAMKDIELAMAINSSDSEAHRIKGEVLKGLKDYSASVAELSKYISMNPNDPKGFFERAYSYERGRRITGNATKSTNDFKKAIELYSTPPTNRIDSFMQNSHLASSYFGLGLAYTQKKEFHNALEAFKNSDKFSPNNKNTIRYIERLKKKIE